MTHCHKQNGRKHRSMLLLFGVGSLFVTGAGLGLPVPAAACDMVCVAPDNYEAMLGRHKHVLVGRVEHVNVSGERYPTTFVVKAIRVWKGRKKQITLVNVSGQCGKTPRANRLYVVFASEDPQSIDMCSPIMGLWEESAKVAITRLDRARRFPPLSVDAEDLKP